MSQTMTSRRPILPPSPPPSLSAYCSNNQPSLISNVPPRVEVVSGNRSQSSEDHINGLHSRGDWSDSVETTTTTSKTLVEDNPQDVDVTSPRALDNQFNHGSPVSSAGSEPPNADQELEVEPGTLIDGDPAGQTTMVTASSDGVEQKSVVEDKESSQQRSTTDCETTMTRLQDVCIESGSTILGTQGQPSLSPAQHSDEPPLVHGDSESGTLSPSDLTTSNLQSPEGSTSQPRQTVNTSGSKVWSPHHYRQHESTGQQPSQHPRSSNQRNSQTRAAVAQLQDRRLQRQNIGNSGPKPNHHYHHNRSPEPTVVDSGTDQPYRRPTRPSHNGIGTSEATPLSSASKIHSDPFEYNPGVPPLGASLPLPMGSLFDPQFAKGAFGLHHRSMDDISGSPHQSPSSTNTGGGMEHCLPPMLAAAAMAALTGGRLPNMPGHPMNPFIPSTDTSSMNHADFMSDSRRLLFQQNTGLNLTAPGSTNYTQPTLTDPMASDASDFFLNPMRLMYNTSKLFFSSGLTEKNCLDTNTTTPPPPPLSASVSPQPPLSRDMLKAAATSGLYSMAHGLGRTGMNPPMESDELDDEMEEDADDEDDDTATGVAALGPDSEELGGLGPEASGTTSNAGQQWTFEEQFKQLYILSEDPKRKDFLDELFAYMQRRGTPVNRIPIMAKQMLDLYELFHLVVARGGLVEVINKKLWREITKGLNLPSSITSAAFTLRTQYMKYLYPYECDTLGLSTPNELQAAIDGNRREARRSSYSFDYPMMLGNTAVGGGGVGGGGGGPSTRSLSPSSLMGPPHPSAGSLLPPGPPGFPTLNLPPGFATNGFNNLPGSTLSFPGGGGSTGLAHPNSGYGLNYPLQPFLGLPSVSGSSVTIPSHHPLFGNSLVPSLSSNATFPLGSNSGLPSSLTQPPAGFGHSTTITTTTTSTPNVSEENNLLHSPPSHPLSSTTNNNNCLFNGLPNSFAAAAALFGAGFPTSLPGAFAATPPTPGTLGFGAGMGISSTVPGHSSPSMAQTMSQSTTATTGASNSSFLHLTSITSSEAHAMGSQSKRIQSHSNNRKLEDVDHTLANSSSPLNLVANESHQSSAASSTTKSSNGDLAGDQNAYSPVESGLLSTGKRERPSVDGTRDEKRSNNLGTHKNRMQLDGEPTDDQCAPGLEMEGIDSIEGGQRIMDRGFADGNTTIKWMPNLDASTREGRNRFESINSEDLVEKSISQATCHQFLAAAAAMQNGLSVSNSEMNLNMTGQKSSPTFHGPDGGGGKNSASFGVKRSASRSMNVIDSPAVKMARTTSSAPGSGSIGNHIDRRSDNAGQTSSQRRTGGGGSSSNDIRRMSDASSSVLQGLAGASSMTNGSQNASVSFSMGSQNLRIQTQSGGPMGLPQNAMVVTMEMGNSLYQGVLFGQLKR